MFFKNSGTKELKQNDKMGEDENPGIVIDCRVNLNVKLPNSVVIGPNGLLYGNITARQVVVKGKIYGNIVGTEKVILKTGASVIGQIISKSLRVDGAVNGEIDLKISSDYTFPDLNDDLLNTKTDEEALQNLIDSKNDGNQFENDETFKELREIEVNKVTNDGIIESEQSSYRQKQKNNFW